MDCEQLQIFPTGSRTLPATPETIYEIINSVMESLADRMGFSDTMPHEFRIAHQAILALAEANAYSGCKYEVVDIHNFFLDEDFRREVVMQCRNPTVKKHYDPETGPYNTMSERDQLYMIAPILRAF